MCICTSVLKMYSDAKKCSKIYWFELVMSHLEHHKSRKNWNLLTCPFLHTSCGCGCAYTHTSSGWYLRRGTSKHFSLHDIDLCCSSKCTFTQINGRNVQYIFFVSVRLHNNSEESKYVHISTIFGTWSTTTKFDIRSIIIIGCQNVQAIQQLRSFL